MIDLSRLGRNAPDPEPKEERETGKAEQSKLKFDILIVNNNPMLEAMCRNQHTLLQAVMFTRDTAIATGEANIKLNAEILSKLLALEESMVAIKKALGIEEVSNGRPGSLGEAVDGPSLAGEVPAKTD